MGREENGKKRGRSGDRRTVLEISVKRIVFILCAAVLAAAGCREEKSVTNPPAPAADWESLEITASVPKWYGGRTAAVTITYDARWNGDPLVKRAADEAVSRGLAISFELVTANFVDSPELIIEMQGLLPRGISFYGHGHRHENFDEKSYEYCFESFSLCYRYMKAWGMNPKAYAYPYGKGFKSTTKLANRMAGFICARGLTFLSNPNYICPDGETEPRDWYYLPTISVAQEFEGYVNDHGMMSEILRTDLEKTAWVILMYHSIGFPGAWGYYPLEDYLEDLDEIAAGDFWCESMGTIAAYIKERLLFRFVSKEVETSDDWADYDVRFWDGLDNDVYDSPLTIDLSFESDIPVKRVELSSPGGGITGYEAVGGKIRMERVPDEKTYRMRVVQVCT